MGPGALLGVGGGQWGGLVAGAMAASMLMQQRADGVAGGMAIDAAL